MQDDCADFVFGNARGTVAGTQIVLQIRFDQNFALAQNNPVSRNIAVAFLHKKVLDGNLQVSFFKTHDLKIK